MAELERDQNALVDEIASICYYFKGVTWDQAWNMTSSQRDRVVKLLEKFIKNDIEAAGGVVPKTIG